MLALPGRPNTPAASTLTPCPDADARRAPGLCCERTSPHRRRHTQALHNTHPRARCSALWATACFTGALPRPSHTAAPTAAFSRIATRRLERPHTRAARLLDQRGQLGVGAALVLHDDERAQRGARAQHRRERGQLVHAARHADQLRLVDHLGHILGCDVGRQRYINAAWRRAARARLSAPPAAAPQAAMRRRRGRRPHP